MNSEYCCDSMKKIHQEIIEREDFLKVTVHLLGSVLCQQLNTWLMEHLQTKDCHFFYESNVNCWTVWCSTHSDAPPLEFVSLHSLL